MTLTKFMARSTWVAHAFEWEKLLKCHLKGKTSKKLANGQNIDYSEKRKRPKGFICPCTGVKYHVYWYMQQTQVSVYRTIGPLVNFHVEVCFSASVLAASVKACIVIVLDMPFKHAPVIAASVKPCIVIVLDPFRAHLDLVPSTYISRFLLFCPMQVRYRPPQRSCLSHFLMNFR